MRLGEVGGRCENTLKALRQEHSYSTCIDTRMWAHREKEIYRGKSTRTEPTPQNKKKILYQRRPSAAWLPLYGLLINLLKPNDIYIYIYICRTATLTSRHYILNICSTNIRTENFKHAA